MFKKCNYLLKNKKGSEILQVIIVIAIVGTLAITVISTFSNELGGALGLKVKDSEWQETANEDIDATKEQMKDRTAINLANH